MLPSPLRRCIIFHMKEETDLPKSCTAPSNPADTISNAITWPAALRRNASAWSSTVQTQKSGLPGHVFVHLDIPLTLGTRWSSYATGDFSLWTCFIKTAAR